MWRFRFLLNLFIFINKVNKRSANIFTFSVSSVVFGVSSEGSLSLGAASVVVVVVVTAPGRPLAEIFILGPGRNGLTAPPPIRALVLAVVLGVS